MMLPARSRPIITSLLVFAVFLGTIYLRALPAWFRGSFTTEGGVWLSQLWQLGFPKSLAAIRPDYCVFGNLVVMQVSDWINTLLHGANLDHAASIQHHLACVYVAAMFTAIFCVLRRSHSFTISFVVCAVMLLMPDLDGENRIFGEVTNLGYFSALVVLFIYHDLCINPVCSKRWLVFYLLLVLFHIATSPLAGMITVAFVGLMVLREVLAGSRAKWNLTALLPHLALVAFAVFTIVRAKRNSPYAHFAADAAQLKSRLVEIVIGRQILYPLILNIYTWFNDARTLFCFSLLLLLIGIWIVIEWKRRHPFDGARITGLLLLFGATLGMAATTALSRQWLILRDESYSSVWPARYYLVQNMVVGAFLALVLARIAELLPKARTAIIVLAALLLANYTVLQKEKLLEYLQQDNPAILARHWPYQLRRVHAMQSMTGDQALALKSSAPGLFHAVEINIENHSMQLSPIKIEKAAATRLEQASDVCPVGLADAAEFGAESDMKIRELVTRNLRAIPRAGGLLVTFDALLQDAPYFSAARRHLWIGRIPGAVQARCFAYSVPNHQELAGGRSPARQSFNWLFKVMLYIDGSHLLADLEHQLTGLTCALGAEPGKYIARGTVLQPQDRFCLSSILGDEKLAAVLHPMREMFHWAGHADALRLQNLSARGDDLVVGRVDDKNFDEVAYIRYNPDIAGAVSRKSVASGRAHFSEFGSRESRQINRYSVALDVSAQKLESDRLSGIRVILQKGRKETPPVINCVLRGEAGQSTSLRLLPPDGGSDFCALFIPAILNPAPFPVKMIEVEFEGVTSERSFQVREIILYQSSTSPAS
ncbi:MAG: hypothetical protein K8R87_04195 [Verrucomicrobia bacterium]|nr:hypothetical protein [Verrucomicrobiota bacterium]